MIIALALALVMIFSTTMNAYAYTSSSSNWKYKTVGTRTYQYRSTVIVRSASTPTIEAQTEVYVYSGTNAPSGYMSAKARLFNISGSMVAYSDQVFNTYEVSNLFVSSSRSTTTAYCCSEGWVAFYTSTGSYTGDVPYASPYLSTASASSTSLPLPDFEYQVNSKGETYGSAQLAKIKGYEPELIAAVGDNGREGYVRQPELNISCEYKEIQRYMGKWNEARIIPVYDKEGNQIDVFTVNGTYAEGR